MLARLFAVVILLAAIPLAAAAPPASPASLGNVDRYVYAEFDLTQPTIFALELDGELWIYRYEVGARSYDADELSAAMQGPNGAAFIASFEAAVESAAGATLSRAFPGSAITDTQATLDEAALRAPGGSSLDPPIHVALTSHVARDRAAMGLAGYSDAAVAAALNAGARVATAFDLPADEGYQISYTVQAPASPAGLRFAQGPDVNGDGTAIFATVDNTAGQTPSRAVVATLLQPSARPPAGEDIRSAVIVDLAGADDELGGIPVTITVTSEMHAIDVHKRMPDVLPPLLALDFVDANGLRALRQTGAIKDEHVAKANEALLSAIRQEVQKSFGGGQVTVAGGLSTEDLGARPSSEPVTFTADATALHKLSGAKAEDLALALKIGGTADLPLEFFSVFGRATSYLVHAPPGTTFLDAGNGDITTSGATASFNVPEGVKKFPASLMLHGDGVPDFGAQVAAVNVTVDLEDLDVSLGEAANGDFGELLMQITVEGQLNVIEVPTELKDSIPPGLGIDHLSSDGVRLLVESGRISEQDLADLEARLVDNVAQKLGAALGGEIPVVGGLDRASLEVDLVSDPVSSDDPIRFRASARVVKPLDGGPVRPEAAIALYTQVMPLTLPKIEGIATTYTVIMPRGLSVEGVDGAASRISKSADGRDQFTVTPEGESANVQVSMAVTPTFVLAKFWPAVLLAVILLVLIVGTPVALVVRKRGKAKKAAAAEKPKP